MSKFSGVSLTALAVPALLAGLIAAPVAHAADRAALEAPDGGPVPAIIVNGEAGQISPALREGEGRALLDMSLEELLAAEVTSAAKRVQSIGDTAAAIYVIGQEDIANSASHSLSDLLRIAPGMGVYQANGSITSVSARGGDSTYSANMLVMVDGAAIYSSSLAGMFWDQALSPMQDIERIEVIRGPGGTLWGANSINGIINIITRQSVDTQGLRADLRGGVDGQRIELGYGRQLQDDMSLRAYATGLRDRGVDGVNGHTFDNYREAGMFGLRLDAAPSGKDTLVALAEVSGSNYREPRYMLGGASTGYYEYVISEPNNFRTFHTLARWHHRASDRLDFSVQGYFNQFYRTIWGSQLSRDLYDLSVEGHWHPNRRHEFNFGLSGRISRDRLTSGPLVGLRNDAATDRWFNFYLQDDIALLGNALRVTVGSKFEVSNFAGFLAQPALRLFWKAGRHTSVWAGVSRAIRTPQLRERAMESTFPSLQSLPGIPFPVPMLLQYHGQGGTVPEKLTSWEMGLRYSPSPRWMLDVALFYNNYRDLNTATITNQALVGTPGRGFFALVIDATSGNSASGRSWGAEVLIKGRPTGHWMTELSWSFIDMDVQVPAAMRAIVFPLMDAAATTRHQLRWKNGVELTDSVSAGAMLHYVGASNDGRRRPYTDLDLRLTWRPRYNLDLSLVGDNVLHDRHVEMVQTILPTPLVAVPRRIYAEAKVRF
ncbi:TonB-dependent receptor [Novosphingobium sp. FSY-8]|uniref:TonB-dependent receptor n=1 Tax=Novosphingobium ovatum TaxID=1908523 RepID=A0ABW9XF00_9SPHN|nr:TonB-dependent receptor [Novosphingobium ovatum]NBC37115.1 TonB-dependent receptor [Novosphingobium ovatum]